MNCTQRHVTARVCEHICKNVNALLNWSYYQCAVSESITVVCWCLLQALYILLSHRPPKLNSENDMLRMRSMSTKVLRRVCGLMTSSFVREAVLVRGSVLWGAAVKHAHLQNVHALIYKHTLFPLQRRAGKRSTSSCSCRAGWRSGRRRSGR